METKIPYPWIQKRNNMENCEAFRPERQNVYDSWMVLRGKL